MADWRQELALFRQHLEEFMRGAALGRYELELRKQTADGVVDRVKLDLAQGATVQTVVEALGINLQEDAILLVVNGKIAEVDTALGDGDEVRLIPAMSSLNGPTRRRRSAGLSDSTRITVAP